MNDLSRVPSEAAWRLRLHEWRQRRRAQQQQRREERFEDQLHHFNKWVKGWDLPPSEYRRAARGLAAALRAINEGRDRLGQPPITLECPSVIGWYTRSLQEGEEIWDA